MSYSTQQNQSYRANTASYNFIILWYKQSVARFMFYATGMAVFLKNVSFHGILLDSLFDEGNTQWEMVRTLLQEGIKSGVVKPLSYTKFGKYEIEEAFRYMATGKHIGKVLIEVIINAGSLLTLCLTFMTSETNVYLRIKSSCARGPYILLLEMLPHITFIDVNAGESINKRNSGVDSRCC